MKARQLLAWIQKNHQEFKTPPIVIEHKPGLMLFKHEGALNWVKSRISFRGKYGCVDLLVDTPSYGIWDMLMSIDIEVATDAQGRFYCNECEHPERFTTEMQLWINHSLMTWMHKLNSFAQPESHLILMGRPNEWTSATISSPVKSKSKREFIFATIPYMNQ